MSGWNVPVCTGSGTTLLDGVDAGPGPPELAATTVNVYGEPFTSPPTVHVSAPVVEQVPLPEEAVT